MKIDNLVKTIETASRGEEVRDALVQALQGVSDAQQQANQSIYKLSISGNTIKLEDQNGKAQTIDLPADDDTTYTLTKDGTVIKLTDSKGNEQTVDIGADQNTTYTLSYTPYNNRLALIGSDGKTSDVYLYGDTTYQMELTGTTLKLTDSNGNVQSVNVVADTTELEKKVDKNTDRFGGLSFSLTDSGLLHIEQEVSS